MNPKSDRYATPSQKRIDALLLAGTAIVFLFILLASSPH